MNLDDLFAHVGDGPIPGGCDQCDAYQTLEKSTTGVIVMTVHHDEWCPFLRSRRAARN